jgi:hypothetical protein
MYLARIHRHGKLTYDLRESIYQNGHYVSRTLARLGRDPEDQIIYPGGNSFYISEELRDSLEDQGVEADYDELEELFWPFVHPGIRRKVGCFRERAKAQKKRPPLTEGQEKRIRDQVHIIDKRRLNYLRLGKLDQSLLGNVPPKLYRRLLNKSRDEIEQDFMLLEMELKPREYALYVYSFLHLRRFFDEIVAGKMPQALDQEKLDQIFLQEICNLNSDPEFWAPDQPVSSLHPYLRRYLIMYFDFAFGPSTYLEDILMDFMARHRFHQRPPRQKAAMSPDETSRIFGVPKDELQSMSQRQVTRIYRRLAKKLHPDQGGDHDEFVSLNQAYTILMERKKRGR